MIPWSETKNSFLCLNDTELCYLYYIYIEEYKKFMKDIGVPCLSISMPEL